MLRPSKRMRDYLTPVSKGVPEWMWFIAKLANSAFDVVPDQVMDGAEESARNLPYAYALGAGGLS